MAAAPADGRDKEISTTGVAIDVKPARRGSRWPLRALAIFIVAGSIAGIGIGLWQAFKGATGDGRQQCRPVVEPVGAHEIAGLVWEYEAFLSPTECDSIVAILPGKDSQDWEECPAGTFGEADFPERRCLRLSVAEESAAAPVLSTVGRRLTETFSDQVDFEALQHIFVKVVDPSPPNSPNASAWIQEDHVDYIPDDEQQGGKGPIPSTTMVIHLTQPTDGHPIDKSGALHFPNEALQVRPRSGTMIAFANVCDDGQQAPNAIHGVGPLTGDDEGSRISLLFLADLPDDPQQTAQGRSTGHGPREPPPGFLRAEGPFSVSYEQAC